MPPMGCDNIPDADSHDPSERERVQAIINNMLVYGRIHSLNDLD